MDPIENQPPAGKPADETAQALAFFGTADQLPVEAPVSLDALLKPPVDDADAPVGEIAAEVAAETAAEAAAISTDAADAAAAALAGPAPDVIGEGEITGPVVGEAPKKEPRKPKGSGRKRNAGVEDLGDGSGYLAPAARPEKTETAPEEEEFQWYAVHCYSGYENKVKHSLEQRIDTMGMAGKIVDVVVPTEEEMEVKDGRRRTVEKRVFPGYIIVKMSMSEEAWYVVRNTPGVTRFVGMGNRPSPLSPQEVTQIVKRMEAEAPKLRVNFKPGQRVRITDGPFADFPAVVDKIDTERAKVTVLVSFFGRETPVELDFLQVERMG
ncbi:MAG TPA: transcription termination/antitermination protein NusG [Thermoflexales bacterium]|nr:transcription termination/antitermination protein NusG [Thermoflexales bacterium]HQX12075.1 transcription termination/antitermination protein NusG [Thermoflexales bacterium]HQY26300.1 transcription termination/antitermination protein NusG [Thermoflexales bacterium]HQZ55049.1 transcription termination/antitermination protein NusG [Thermoflexales bacterium]HRA54832.1 transcription termination/antitermination protein NusG [Thermoflexales bacterium]